MTDSFTERLDALRSELEAMLDDSLVSMTPIDFSDPLWFCQSSFDESKEDFHSGLNRWARTYATEHFVAQAREENDAYHGDLVYMAEAPVANSIGLEVGFATRNQRTNAVQRSGIGFYVRSDHAFNKTYQAMPTI